MSPDDKIKVLVDGEIAGFLDGVVCGSHNVSAETMLAQKRLFELAKEKTMEDFKPFWDKDPAAFGFHLAIEVIAKHAKSRREQALQAQAEKN